MNYYNDGGGPEYRAGIVIGLLFIFALASYIILLNHSKAHAQDIHNFSYTKSYRQDMKIDNVVNSMDKHVIVCRQRYRNQDLLYKFCRTPNEDFGSSCHEDMKEYAKHIIKYALIYNIDPWLFLAIAYHETRFDAYVVGKVKKERGIFQINPNNKHAKGSKFIHNKDYRTACKAIPGHCQEEVIHVAAKIFYDAIKACGGNTKRALSAYNSGYCSPIRKDYVFSVLEHRNSLINPQNIDINWCD